MKKSKKALRYFHEVRDPDETFHWIGGPVFAPFLARSLPLLAVGIAWGLFDIFFFFGFTGAGGHPFFLLFFLAHMMPCWVGVLNFVRLIVVHGNTFYAVSNKRVILRSGFWGIDYKIYDFDRLSDIEVNVNLIERIFGCGTIRLHAGRPDDQGNNFISFLKTNEHMYSIRKPYYVFRNLKQVATDTKTDWLYPNALRPTENPGYGTEYTGDGFSSDERPKRKRPATLS